MTGIITGRGFPEAPARRRARALRWLAPAAVALLLASGAPSGEDAPDPGPIRPDIVTVRINPRILTNDLGRQEQPAISGKLIVFTDWRNAQADIYLWDLGTEPNTETRLTSGPRDEHSPDISGRLVVWVEGGPETGGGDIMALHLDGGGVIPVAVDPGARQTRPAVKGTLVAWEDDRDGNPEIYARDLATGVEKRITDTPDLAETEPAVDAGRVAFTRSHPDGTCQIHMTDFATGQTRQITDAPTCFRRPDIEGNFIVYDGTPGGTQDVFVFDLRTGEETRVVLAGIQRDAHISGAWLSAEKVAMVPFQNSNVKIYNIPNQVPLEPLTAETNEFDSDISGRVVVYTTDALGNFDIAMYEFTPIGLNEAPVADAGPDLTVGCASAAGATVGLDGSGSFDPDGDPLTYRWTGPFADGTLEAEGPAPSVPLPLGRSTVTLVVNDGQEDSEPDSAEIRVLLEARGLQPVMHGMEMDDGVMASTGRAHRAGSTLPLRLFLGCGGAPLTDADIAPPRVLSIDSAAGAGGPAADTDAGRSSGGGTLFRHADGAWIHNFTTRGLAPGEYVVWIGLPDGRRAGLPLTLR